MNNADYIEAQERKARSMAVVAERGIFVMEMLPHIETEVTLQTTEDVARRAACLTTVAIFSESILNPEIGETAQQAREYVEQIIQQYGVENDFSAREQALLDSSDPTRQELINHVWQYENLGVMLWALGMFKLEFPTVLVKPAELVDIVASFGSLEEMIAAATLRSREEILDAADLIFRIDWACVEARIHGKEAPAGLDSGVVMERHKSLNWLIRKGEDWDKIDIST